MADMLAPILKFFSGVASGERRLDPSKDPVKD